MQIEHTLLEYRHIKRLSEEFAVKVVCTLEAVIILNNCFMSMMRLFLAMESTKEWMDIRLITTFQGSNKLVTQVTGIKQLFYGLGEMREQYTINYGECRPDVGANNECGYRIVISNANCKIMGIQHSVH